MPISERFYLADAVFVAAVEGDPHLIDTAHEALRRPRFLPYLGRRSCPAARPIELRAHRDLPLDRALRDEPWHAAEWYQRRHRTADVTLRTLIETTDGAADSLRDQPISFDPRHRRYALRGYRLGTVTVANPVVRRPIPDHDPTSLLEGT